MEAAIRASLAESTAPQENVSTSNPIVQNSDNENSSSSKCQTFSTQNSEDEDVEIETFETDSEESSHEKVNNSIPAGENLPASNSEKNSIVDNPVSDWKQHLGVSEGTCSLL